MSRLAAIKLNVCFLRQAKGVSRQLQRFQSRLMPAGYRWLCTNSCIQVKVKVTITPILLILCIIGWVRRCVSVYVQSVRFKGHRIQGHARMHGIEKEKDRSDNRQERLTWSFKASFVISNSSSFRLCSLVTISSSVLLHCNFRCLPNIVSFLSRFNSAHKLVYRSRWPLDIMVGDC